MCNKKPMEYILCKEYLAKKRSFIKKNEKKAGTGLLLIFISRHLVTP